MNWAVSTLAKKLLLKFVASKVFFIARNSVQKNPSLFWAKIVLNRFMKLKQTNVWAMKPGPNINNTMVSSYLDQYR